MSDGELTSEQEQCNHQTLIALAWLERSDNRSVCGESSVKECDAVFVRVPGKDFIETRRAISMRVEDSSMQTHMKLLHPWNLWRNGEHMPL